MAKVEQGDWRGEVLARVRALINEADPEVVEEVKWRKPTNPDGVRARHRADLEHRRGRVAG